MNALRFAILLLIPSMSFATTIELDTYLGGDQSKLAGKSALAFTFSHQSKTLSTSDNNSCNIITTDKYLRSTKGRLENINLTEPNFFFDCEWEGKYYMLSNRYPTYAEVIIKPPDEHFPMTMHIEAKLVTLTGEMLEVISGDIPLKSGNKRVW
ncbi:hypothetical protein [Shewanella sp. UCD-KL12]|uniref:hypothetical protein n=1 Tax=Shewanella sp. UCD-KL12 TaxID=1917163 RepID=UPI002115E684|nr:hypothetical protein [Shewanella sp. UCD-KL12]